jgi:hypothetical protein
MKKKMSSRLFGLAASSGIILALVLGLSAVAWAQATTTSTTTTTTTTGATGGGAGIGVGASAFLSGLAGVQVDYDQYAWDLEGVFGFSDVSTGPNLSRTDTRIGGRGWYHLHHGSSSDFSIGGGVGVEHDSGGGAPAVTATVIEPAVRARAFITPNVAVHAIAGISVILGDDGTGVNGNRATGVEINAQLLAGFGFTYFFR